MKTVDSKNRIYIPESTESDISSDDKKKIIRAIKRIVNTHTLCDEEWTKAISSQNFLVDLAFELNMNHDKSFENLLNIFLGSFSPQFDGGYRMNKKNILIIPDENKKLIECMEMEDETDSYYVGSLSASQITNPDIIYQNYLYGIMVNISSAANNTALSNVFNHCTSELLKSDALDLERGGWIHYRLPWITARIVLGFQNVLNNNRIWIPSDKYENIKKQTEIAKQSLISRIYKLKYWRSGAGNWVSKWESTGLCLEVFLTSDEDLSDDSIDNVIEYLFNDEVVPEWLPNKVDFSSEESTNTLLAQVVLCSVLYRYLKLRKWEKYAKWRMPIGKFFYDCIEYLTSSDNNMPIRQFCTMPQILLYISKAIGR